MGGSRDFLAVRGGFDYVAVTMENLLQRIDDALARADRALSCGLRWPLILLVSVFVLKAVYVVQSADALHVRVPIMDSRYYDEMAQDIARGNVVRGEAFFMGPLYPYLLAFLYKIVGRDFMVVRLLQVLGGALTVALAFAIGRRLFRPTAALAGAALLAFDGAMTFYESQLLMEGLGTLLNCVALCLLVSARDDVSPRRAALTGAVLGLSALARASILLFAAFVAAWLWRRQPRARAVARGCVRERADRRAAAGHDPQPCRQSRLRAGDDQRGRQFLRR